MPAGGGGVAGKPGSHRGRCSYAEDIGEAWTHRRSTRPGCECQPAAELPATRFAPRAVLLHRHIREARAHRRSTRPGCECQPAVAGLPATRFAPGAGAPTWGMAQVHGVQPGAKAYPMTPPLLTLYTWRL